MPSTSIVQFTALTLGSLRKKKSNEHPEYYITTTTMILTLPTDIRIMKTLNHCNKSAQNIPKITATILLNEHAKIVGQFFFAMNLFGACNREKKREREQGTLQISVCSWGISVVWMLVYASRCFTHWEYILDVASGEFQVRMKNDAELRLGVWCDGMIFCRVVSLEICSVGRPGKMFYYEYWCTYNPLNASASETSRVKNAPRNEQKSSRYQQYVGPTWRICVAELRCRNGDFPLNCWLPSIDF